MGHPVMIFRAFSHNVTTNATMIVRDSRTARGTASAVSAGAIMERSDNNDADLLSGQRLVGRVLLILVISAKLQNSRALLI